MVSSVTHRGLDPLLEALWLHASQAAAADRDEEVEDAWEP